MSGLNRRFVLGAVALPLWLLAMLGLSCAATITVNTLADPTGAAGTCSLRQAISNANGQNTSGSTNCAAGSGNNDTIIFASGLTGSIMLGSTLPTITDTNLTIIGPTGSPGITISGGGHVQLFSVPVGPIGPPPYFGFTLGPTLNLQLLTLTKGNAKGVTLTTPGTITSGGGGAIASGGTLNVTNCTFSDNQGSYGGAIYSYGDLNVSNSTFSGNQAAGSQSEGGAIFAEDIDLRFEYDTVTNCTFSGNTAGTGSAAFANIMYITDCTFSGNHAPNPNEVQEGGAVCNDIGSVIISGSILANNTGTNCSCDEGGLELINEGYNISDDNTCGFGHSAGASGQFIGDRVNPQLASGLANNGGPTETIALLAGSPAIAAVRLAKCTVGTDQRGLPRPSPGYHACDIGAYEFQPLCPPGEGWTKSGNGFQCMAIPRCPATCKTGCIVIPPGVPPNNKPGASKPIFACKNAQGGIGTFNRP